MATKIIRSIALCGLLAGLVSGTALASDTEIKINAPQDQKYSLDFNVKESICIKNVESLAKTIGKKGNSHVGVQTIPVVRDMSDEDGACPNTPAVLYFTLNTSSKVFACLLSYEFGGSKITGFKCHDKRSKETIDKCIATKLDKNSGEISVTC